MKPDDLYKKFTEKAQFGALKLFLIKISKDNLFLYAQALTFNTLLTLIPLLGLILSLGRSFLNEDLLLQRIFNFLSNYLYAEAVSIVMEKIVTLLEGLKKLPLGKFSLILYFLMSLGILFQIEDALNRIFLAPRKRSLRDRILLYWIALTLAPFVLLIPVLIQTSIQFHQEFQLVSYFLFIFLFFYLLYAYFPARRIARFPTAIGALLITLLWYLMSLAFAVYVQKAVIYSKLYGSLSIIPLFLIFLFVNWTVFLLGAELTYFLEKKPWKKFTFKIPSPLRELLLLIYIARSFYEGKLVTIKTLESALPLSDEDIVKALNSLEDKRLIYLKDEDVFLRNPPEKITLYQLVTPEDLTLLKEKLPELRGIVSGLNSDGTISLNLSIKDILDRS